MEFSAVRFFTDRDRIESEAIEQIRQTSSLPFIRGMAVMPDVHLGTGSTIGTVIATDSAVMPACIGVDIGCGMIAVKTDLRFKDIEIHLGTIRQGIERRVPTGVGAWGINSRILPQVEKAIGTLEARSAKPDKYDKYFKDWRNTIGTLGGGNHFIELCREDILGMPAPESAVWIILHSGSRGVGHAIATYWIKVAKRQAKKYLYDSFLPHQDLAYLIHDSEDFWSYITDLNWAQDFALLNREEMMNRILDELLCTLELDASAEIERINCHHNFAQWENHDGKNLLITRKGAIEAKVGMKGLIPGSMGSNSYIVEGLGHTGSFNSAPHGAGRAMSRKKARNTFTLEGLRDTMSALNIEARVREEILDEAPGAYKSIDHIILEARDLVKVVTKLTPILSVKGD